jgi:hypothetical protein
MTEQLRVHPHTAAFLRMLDRSRLPDHVVARFKWLAWIHWSSRSRANFHHLIVG